MSPKDTEKAKFPTHDSLLNAHRELDYQCRNRNGRPFISDWYCDNPFAGDILSPNELSSLSAIDLLDYYYPNDGSIIHEQVQRFHSSKLETTPSTDEVFIASGLTSLISSQLLYLKHLGKRRIAYLRPLYYTYYFLARTLEIELVPYSDPDPENLENFLSTNHIDTIVICDPVWFLGRSLGQDWIDTLSALQAKNGLFVYVDGAFQYLRWIGNDSPEPTSRLDPDLTIRNLCPTKMAAVHGPRFAYCLHPKAMREDVRYFYSNTAGSASRFDFYAAQQIMNFLLSANGNSQLISHIRTQYEELVRGGYVIEEIKPVGSYFVFVKLPIDVKNVIAMDQTFFDYSGMPDLVRLNLLLKSTEMSKFKALVEDFRN